MTAIIRVIKSPLVLLQNSLLRNSIYLMLGAAVLAGFGFFFWLISAHLLPADIIGLATTLVSVLNMITVLSLVGFDTTVVRFLSQSKERNNILNTGMTLVTFAALALGISFVLLVPFISPQLKPLIDPPAFALTFLLFCVLCSLNLFTSAAFIAYRESGFTLLSNTFFSVIKIFLPFTFIAWGAFGIFAAAAAAQSIGFLFNLYVLVRKFDYRPRLYIDFFTLKQVWRYSLGNYAAGTLNLIPLTILPVLITNRLGPAPAAYFYIAMTIGSLLYTIPAATSRSLLAEGSHDDTKLEGYAMRSAYTTALFLLPSIAVLFAGGTYILRIFGPEYAANGTMFLYIIVLSSLAVGVYSLYSSLLRIRHNIRALIAVNSIYAAGIIGGSYLLLPFGLVGIGLVWIGMNMLAAILSYLWYRLSEDQMLAAKISDFRSLVLPSKLYYMRARLRGTAQKTILCYPETPQFFHTLYMVLRRLGCRITNDPHLPFDRAIMFEDATVRSDGKTAQELLARHSVINEKCRDISKKNVDRVFTEVFGYSSFVDPRTHRGTCVKKSDGNATHDGEIIVCPAEPEAGFVYQKLITCQNSDGELFDLRVPYFNGLIPFVCRRFHAASDRFDKTIRVELAAPEDVFSADEVARLNQFCTAFGLAYGELDILRDTDGTLYIVDANTTPAGPRAGQGMRKDDFETFITGLSEAFEKAFLS